MDGVHETPETSEIHEIRERPILLVDDDANDVELTRWAFRSSNVVNELVVARDGIQALDLLLPEDESRAPLKPSMILMDGNMPYLGRVETLRRLRADARTRHVPVIMLTSSHFDQDILDSSGVGANGYVTKPLDPGDFQKLATVLGQFWLDLHQQSSAT